MNATNIKDVLKILGLIVLLRCMMILAGFGFVHVPLVDEFIGLCLELLREVSLFLYGIVQNAMV